MKSKSATTHKLQQKKEQKETPHETLLITLNEHARNAIKKGWKDVLHHPSTYILNPTLPRTFAQIACRYSSPIGDGDGKHE